MSLPDLLVLLAAATPGDAPPAIPTSAVAEAAPATGVIPYEPAFFAASQPNTAMDMISRLPGFTFDRGDNQVRGYSGSLGNVLIDGSPPASKSDTLEDVLRRIPAGSVERIDVIRGGAPGIDMQGRAVVANVVRKTSAGKTGLFATALNSVYDGRVIPQLRLEGSVRGGGKSAEGSLLLYGFVDDGAGEGPRIRTDGSGDVIERAYHDQTAGGKGLQAKAGAVTPLLKGELRANTSLKLEAYNFEFFDLEFLSDARQFNRDEFDELSGEVGGTWLRKFSPKLELEAVALQRLKKSDFFSDFDTTGFSALFTDDALSGESIGRVTLRYKPSAKLSFEGGAEGAFNFLESEVTYAENGSRVPLPSSDVRVEEKRGEAFIQGAWRVNAKLTLEAGSRFETSTISQSGDTATSQSFFYSKPRLLVTFSPNTNNQLRLRLQQEVGQLDFGDFVSETTFSAGTIDAGNPDLHPDRTLVAEAAYERRFWGKGAAVLTYRYKKVTDAIDRVPIFTSAGVLDAPGNIGDGAGHEVAFNLTLPLDRLGIKGGQIRGEATWRRIMVTDPTTGERRRVSEVNPFRGEAHFTQDLPAQKLTWGLDLYSANTQTFYRFDEIRSFIAHTWLTAFIEYKPKPNLSLRAEANNITSRDFIRRREVYAGPRSTSPLLYVEDRPLNFGPGLYLRLRRTFG